MKKDNYRTILSEKFKAANQLETGTLTEEDEEYLRILAEARANHAKIKAARQEARKHLAARVAAVLIIAALVSSSYLLGMKSDTKASADNDDEVKVVQQGDNIIIGPGVREDDENVGVVTKTYYRLEDVPEEVIEEIYVLNNTSFQIKKIELFENTDTENITLYYEDIDGNSLIIRKQQSNQKQTIVLHDLAQEREINGQTVYESSTGGMKTYLLNIDSVVYRISMTESTGTNKNEALIYDLVTRMSLNKL